MTYKDIRLAIDEKFINTALFHLKQSGLTDKEAQEQLEEWLLTLKNN